MQLSRSLSYLFLFLFSAAVYSQDTPNDDSDDDLPSCAAACSNALSSSAVAQGASSGDVWPSACQNSGIIAAFNDCSQNAQCSDDDKEGAGDWIHSTCRVVARTASATHTTTPASTTSSASSTTSGTTSTTASSSTTSATATATSTPDHGLSTGAKVGIGLGVALGVLLLAAAIAAFCIHKMRKSRRDSQALWPNNVNGWEQVQGERTALTGGAAAGAAAGGAMAERGRGLGGSRFEPQDPYGAWTPQPGQPELGTAGARHELHGQDFHPWNEMQTPANGIDNGGGVSRGVDSGGLPASLAIGGGAAGAAAAANGLKYVSELDGSGITPAALARKPVNPLRFSQDDGQSQDRSQRQSEVSEPSSQSDTTFLSPGPAPGPLIERPISAISTSSNDNDDVSASRVPLPRSPVSPSSPTMRAWQG